MENEKPKEPLKSPTLRLEKRFFEKEHLTGFNTADTQRMHSFVFKRVQVSEDKGIMLHFHGCLHPRKGFPFPEATYAMDTVKAYTMSLVMSIARKEMILPAMGFFILPWKKKLAFIQNAISLYTKFGHRVLSPVYLKPQYTTPTTRAVKHIVRTFLENLGIDAGTAIECGKVFSTLIEYDNAYRWRIQDIFSEFEKKEFVDNPGKALKKVMNLVKERDQQIAHKINAYGNLLRIGLFLSKKVRAAFKEAILTSDFEQLQADEADKYHSLLTEGYNFQGLSIDDRIEKWFKIHNGNCPPQVETINE